MAELPENIVHNIKALTDSRRDLYEDKIRQLEESNLKYSTQIAYNQGLIEGYKNQLYLIQDITDRLHTD